MTGLTDPELREIELLAVDLARVAGAEASTMFGQTLSVRYKGDAENQMAGLDPVSEVDRTVEIMLRARLADRFPTHRIIGEEVAEPGGGSHSVAWALDPIDGTASFVNGFPLFAASIGVLHDGVPVCGAVWCASTHALRPGVYHARRGGPLRFEKEDPTTRSGLGLRRRLAGEPRPLARGALPWDSRKTGSAAVDCAFVAAGLLRVSRFETPNLWDVAGGIPLVLAAGGVVRWRDGDGRWHPFSRFAGDLGTWKHALILGDPEAVELRCAAE
ncbi:inositol monophosphatase family protein [Caenispirillum bisanense]|uniref:Myo-inositol-1(Or 4)-monophosphatase n=1 Tax=Caenispirillum bisanense TaxID=414052 RepID=A0A286GRI6_9PROT|nr:inositol monophosphatase [Caenispirillum bisanense]SOD98140.1 myo-inositol-1(or 4)-monophosphatase [Caenispirillum bisanense]